MVASSKTMPYSGYDKLALQLDKATPKSIYSVIANAPFKNELEMALLFLGFICVYVVDEKVNRIRLKAASDTAMYHLAVDHFSFDAKSYYLEFDKNKDNSIVRAIVKGKPQRTTDWSTLNRGKTPLEIVRLNQASSGIACSVIYPLESTVRGALMFSYYQYPDQIGTRQEEFMRHYTKLVSKYLARP
jgi:hypothetical protein